VLQDLKNARTIVQWVAWAEPDYDFGPVMDEWCNEVPKELNFNLEAGISSITFIQFGRVYRELW
jgi:aarF domain-containing kinase